MIVDLTAPESPVKPCDEWALRFHSRPRRRGLNRDLWFNDADRVENIRRAGEVARLMLDAGLIVLWPLFRHSAPKGARFVNWLPLERLRMTWRHWNCGSVNPWW
jgi:Adenylylsulphate kinase